MQAQNPQGCRHLPPQSRTLHQHPAQASQTPCLRRILATISQEACSIMPPILHRLRIFSFSVVPSIVAGTSLPKMARSGLCAWGFGLPCISRSGTFFGEIMEGKSATCKRRSVGQCLFTFRAPISIKAMVNIASLASPKDSGTGAACFSVLTAPLSKGQRRQIGQTIRKM